MWLYEMMRVVKSEDADEGERVRMIACAVDSGWGWLRVVDIEGKNDGALDDKCLDGFDNRCDRVILPCMAISTVPTYRSRRVRVSHMPSTPPHTPPEGR